MTSTHDIANETKDQATELGEHARGAGQDVASGARSAAVDVAGTAKEQAAGVASTARDELRDFKSQASGQFRTQAEDQTRRLAQNLRQMSEQLRQMATQSDSEGPARDLVHRAAHHGTRAADFIESRGPSGIMDEVQQFARRRPGLFLLGAAAAGAAIGRLTRAVKQQSDRTQDDGTSQYAATGAAEPRYAGEPEHISGPQYVGLEPPLPETTAAAGASAYGPPMEANENIGGER